MAKIAVVTSSPLLQGSSCGRRIQGRRFADPGLSPVAPVGAEGGRGDPEGAFALRILGWRCFPAATRQPVKACGNAVGTGAPHTHPP